MAVTTPPADPGSLRRNHFGPVAPLDERAVPARPRARPAEPTGAGRHEHLLLQGDRTEEAFRLARQVAAREPKNATALFVAGIAAGRLRRPDEALALIRQTGGIEPDNAEFQVALRHLERTVVKA